MHIFEVCSFVSLNIYIYIYAINEIYIYPEAINEIKTMNIFTAPKGFLSAFLLNKSESSVLGFKGVQRKCLPFQLGHFHLFWRCKYVHNLRYFFRLCQVRLYFPFSYFTKIVPGLLFSSIRCLRRTWVIPECCPKRSRSWVSYGKGVGGGDCS